MLLNCVIKLLTDFLETGLVDVKFAIPDIFINISEIIELFFKYRIRNLVQIFPVGFIRIPFDNLLFRHDFEQTQKMIPYGRTILLTGNSIFDELVKIYFVNVFVKVINFHQFFWFFTEYQMNIIQNNISNEKCNKHDNNNVCRNFKNLCNKIYRFQ